MSRDNEYNRVSDSQMRDWERQQNNSAALWIAIIILGFIVVVLVGATMATGG